MPTYIQYLITSQKTELRIGDINQIKKDIESDGVQVTNIQTITL